MPGAVDIDELDVSIPERAAISISSDDDDDNDQDDDDDCSSVTSNHYDANDEDFPPAFAYSADLVDVKRRLDDMIKSICKALTGDSQSPYVQGFRNHVVELVNGPHTTPLKIALSGSVGTGKSSLLNCLIDSPDLAPAVSYSELSFDLFCG